MPSLYKNSEGKILLSSGGRIIKQPYNFGKWFSNKMGLNNYIKISNLNLSANCNILQWSYAPTTTTSGYQYPFFNLRNGSDNISNSLICYTPNFYYGVSLNNTPSNGNINRIVSIIQATQAFNSYILRTDLSTMIKSNYQSSSKISTANNIPSINEISICANRASTGTSVNNFAPPEQKQNIFAIFNRELSTSEFLFAFSNNCGSEFLSLVGCEIFLKCDFAEILDFSALQDGSDLRVGVRDYSGFNRHGEIMNLPAGTIQYKLDYANTNLFV